MIPTAEEFFMKFKHTHGPNSHYKALIEFAKIHVEAALTEASNSRALCTAYTDDGLDYKEYKLCKESVLNSYPESNIK